MKARIGIDGNCAFALLGKNLQSGEAEFVEISTDTSVSLLSHERAACEQALENLRKRLKKPCLEWFYDKSHPDYRKKSKQ